MPGLDYFFNPGSIAVIGASRSPQKVGHVIFRNFIEGNFKGKVFPVNPNATELFGKICYPSVSAIKEKIDLAVITVPAELVLKSLEECGKAKVPAAIVVTAGFREIGNAKLEDKLKETAKKYKIRLIGPNCLGVFDPYSGVDTFFLPHYKLERPGQGNIAFISQSGALGSVVMDWMAMKGYKISRFISYGNAADVNESDLIEWLDKDEKTSVICAYFEGVNEGRRFFEAAKKTAAKKPIIALKAGTTDAGKSATLSHTGSLAGQIEIYDGVFKQAGIIPVTDLEQIFDYGRVLSTQPRPKGPKLQVITDGGGFGVLAMDAISKNNLQPAKMSVKNIDRIRKASPPHIVLGNPIDLTGDADVERYRVAISAALDDPGVDMIALITLFQIPTLTADIVEVIIELAKPAKKPMVVIAAGGRYTEVLKKSLEDAGIPCFSYPERAVQSLAALYNFSKNK